MRYLIIAWDGDCWTILEWFATKKAAERGWRRYRGHYEELRLIHAKTLASELY